MINAMQHIAIGVSDIDESYRFYRDILGFRLKLTDAVGQMPDFPLLEAAELQANSARIGRQTIRVVMALNPHGGPAIELAQVLSTTPRPPKRPAQWGGLGMIELGIQIRNLYEFCHFLEQRGVSVLTPADDDASSQAVPYNTAYIRDPDGLLIQLVECANDEDKPRRKEPRSLGILHVGVGVADIDIARRFYGDALGFDEVTHAWEGTLEVEQVSDGAQDMKVVWLGRSKPSCSAVPAFDRGLVKLVQVAKPWPDHLFTGRRWGDLGLFEIALDVCDLPAAVAHVAAHGSETIWPLDQLTMGVGSQAQFAAFEDPDGNEIELVQLQRFFFMPPQIPACLAVAAAKFADINLNVSPLMASTFEI